MGGQKPVMDVHASHSEAEPEGKGSDNLKHPTMVWEVKTNQMPSTVQKVLLVVDKRMNERGMNEALDLLKYDLPELQAVHSDSTPPALFQLSANISHQEYTRPSWNQHTSGSSPESASPCEDGVNWLTELANIATSPQSPLMQCSFYNTSSPVHLLATSKSLHSYARPPPEPSPSETVFPKHHVEETPIRHERTNSESESGIFCMSSLSDDDDLGWCHSWPPTVWHCFLKGTRLCFHKGRNKEWIDVEDFAGLASCRNEADDSKQGSGSDGRERLRRGSRLTVVFPQGYAADGLKLISHEESVSFGESVLKLTFDPGTAAEDLLTVECRLAHPFYVKNKVLDIAGSEGHVASLLIISILFSYDFTPMDSSAVYVLSSMARQRRASLSCGGSGSQDFERSDFGPAPSTQTSSVFSKSGKNHNSGTASTVSVTSPNKCKRPMNAFMLFAKKYRVEYTQMYPGKDNRAISVILGDRWKKMKNEERRMYTLEAKALAEEQKRLNPDCWKRKRTNSGSQ
ncbi:hypothetical protein Chor_002495 [Crotalus horridus]